MRKALLSFAVTAFLVAGFVGLISHLLWRFFWAGFGWALFVLIVFAIFDLVVCWIYDQVVPRGTREQ